MLKTPLIVLASLFGVLSSTSLNAQVGANNPGATFRLSSEDPVQNVPYSAKRCFTETKKLANGTMGHSEYSGSIARDSQGRTYTADERRVTYFDDKTKKNALGTEVLYRIDDPVAKSETRWDTTSKTVKVIRASRTQPDDACKDECFNASVEAFLNPPGDTVEKLGEKTVNAFVVEGTRSSYTIPAGKDHNDQPIVVTRESWYSPELKVVILVISDDPRSGSTKDELLDIVLGEPDVTQYRPPASYEVREIQ
jgi:hypothetical protein